MNKNEHGVIDGLLVAAIVVIMAVGGLVVYRITSQSSTDTPEAAAAVETEDEAEVPASQDESAAEPEELQAGTFDGKTGTLQASGYVFSETVPEGLCDVDCEEYNVAFFYISETPNEQIAGFIEDYTGNSFVRDNAVSLGCVEDGIISAVGSPSGSGSITLSEEDSTTLLESSEAEPVNIELNRIEEPSAGRGAHTCYSHFDTAEVL